MGIEVASSFTRKSPVPLDDSTVVADLTARDAIDPGIRYIGMIVFVESEGVNFQLIGGITNGDWQELSGGGGGAGGGASRWLPTPGSEPLRQIEYGLEPFIFGSGLGQEITRGYAVPPGRKIGKPLSLVVRNYCHELTSDNRVIRLVSTLIKAGGYLSDTTNQHTSDITLSSGTVNRPDESTHEVTDSSGQINGVDVEAGDMILMSITRPVAVSNEFLSDLYLPTELIEGPK